ncbi:hypothetical protein X743_14990 [Mesorhizobium sp. LNHC252B00]|uniref:hypothetical protein n=1 Tax=Mesorhizobium sp. LNHC252B00 TaxID=1287252 RepID=UPI0003CEF8DF|nr:hypothetical protein [Mesorhizobium sp. LNHC252B00]ESY72807.1 hypothetical protein X743_14990 [Mesorhizobium sp. LNHC252B00]
MDETQLFKDVGVIMGLRFEGEDSLRKIAGILRRGNLDQRFLDELADLIDPDVLCRRTGTEKLIIKRLKGERPKRKKNRALQEFMERNHDFYGEKYDAVVAAAKDKFGVGKTLCDEALQRARKRQKADPSFFALNKETCLTLREAGIEEYQSLK